MGTVRITTPSMGWRGRVVGLVTWRLIQQYQFCDKPVDEHYYRTVHTSSQRDDWMTDKCVEIRIGSSAGYLPYCNGTHLQCSTKVPP